MGILDKAVRRDGSGGFAGGLIRLVLRFFQFVLALTVAGLYGVVCLVSSCSALPTSDPSQDLQKASYADGKWVYAEVVAGLSAVTCLVYAGLFFLPSEKLFAWDWILL